MSLSTAQPAPAANEPETDPGYPKAPFYIGVTGHMDLDASSRQEVEATLAKLFAWLQRSRKMDPMQEPPADPLDGPGLGLQATPLVVLSSLAPGADHWVAKFAKGLGFRVLAPLPFARDLYQQASTFNPESGPQSGEAREAIADALVFLEQQAEEDLFLVRLKGEENTRIDLIRDQDKELLTGKARKPERDRRYAAAGEYVAGYSDLLIVLADPNDQQNAGAKPKEKSLSEGGDTPEIRGVGAYDIADVRRRGLTPGLLPILPALSWADNGPLLRITAYRRKTPPEARAAKPPGTSEWLFPFDSRPEDCPAAPDFDPRWQEKGMRELREFTRNLEEFNAEVCPGPTHTEKKRLADEWLSMLRLTSVRRPILHRTLVPAEGSDEAETAAAVTLCGELQRVARLRRWAGDLNAKYDEEIKGLRIGLFVAAFAAAFFLAAFESFVFPRATAFFQGAAEPITLWRGIFFGLWLLATAGSLALWWKFHGEVRDRQRTDYRAVAEGLRVQYYWMAAGTGQSVASAYLQRQRGDLSWIRAAISSVGFPYERSALAFAALRDPRAQVELLRGVQEGWLDAQATYYRRRVQDFRQDRHTWRSLGSTLIWTALTLSIIGVMLGGIPGAPELVRETRNLWLLLGVLTWFGLVQWARSLRSAAAPSDGEPSRAAVANPAPAPNPETDPEPWLTQVIREVEKWGDRASAALGKSFPDHGAEPGAVQRISALALAVAALSLTLLGVSFHLGGLTHDPAHIPAEKILNFFKAMTVSVGVLAGLWISARFLTDNLRRYGEMAALFSAASRRLDDHLGALERAVRDRDETMRTQALKDSQDLIVELGKEALFENSEWLAMHRNRPIEPVTG